MLLENKKILIMGIRNKWSIAYGIAKSAYENGAKLIFTYMGEDNKDKIEELIKEFKGAKAYVCNGASEDAVVRETFEKIKKENGKIVRIKEAESMDLEITFKSIDVAFLMFTGRLGVSKAYAEHRFTLKGEIGKAMSLVRCIDIAEAYLFPKFITKNILKEIPKKSMGLVRCYGNVLFGRV